VLLNFRTVTDGGSMNKQEFTAVASPVEDVTINKKPKKEKKKKFSIFSAIFQTITCCLPSWARYFIVNVYHASIPESMWFEDVGVLPHFYKNMITLIYNAGYFAVFFYFVKSAYDKLFLFLLILMQENVMK